MSKMSGSPGAPSRPTAGAAQGDPRGHCRFAAIEQESGERREESQRELAPPFSTRLRSPLYFLLSRSIRNVAIERIGEPARASFSAIFNLPSVEQKSLICWIA
jgi:hypothetical protein